MTTTATTTESPPRKRRRRRLVVDNVDWRGYTRFLRAFEERSGYRLAYDRGRLEIIAPSFEHDDDSRFFVLLIQALTEELGQMLIGAGSVTMRRKVKQKGIEADESFWIGAAEKMIGVRKLDLKIHPPPDLCIECEVSHSSLNRFGIYDVLHVPEIWRLDGDDLRFYRRNSAGGYSQAANSLAFPLITPDDLMVFIQQVRTTADWNSTIRRFREWLRQRLGE